jgi:tetratricopeptide (TPR) repeat protein
MIELHTTQTRCRLLAATLCFSCILFARRAEPQGTTTPTAGNRFTPIASALQNKEFSKALELLSPALQASPGNAQLWSMQGVAYSGEGRSKEALAAFHKALKIAPNDLRALEGAAQIEYEIGSGAAVPLLERVLRLRPADPVTHGMLAVLEYRQGNCEAATMNFEKTGPLFDGQLEALHAYAICLVRLKQFDKAAVVFQRAVAVHPDDERERHLLASIQLMAQQPQAALATLGPLLAGGHPDAGTLELASTAYEGTKDTTQAVSNLRQALLLDPKNVNLYLDFANLSFVHESFQVGIDVINDGIELQPKAAPLYFARGVLYVSLAQYGKAESDFQKAYELDPSQSLSVAAQGLAAAQQNDLDRALGKVGASLAQKPNDALLLYLQADILSQKGADPGTPEFETAMRSATQAVSLQPSLGAARGVLAKLYLQAGRNQEAVEQCRKALESDAKDQTVVYHLIQGLRKTGKQDEIPELLKRLALLREQATKKDRERSRYKLVEDDSLPTPSVQP